MGYVARANRNWRGRRVTLQKVGMPKSRITCHVKTDGVPYRKVCLTVEACWGVRDFFSGQAANKSQDEAAAARQQVADEPVVVLNFEPLKLW